MVLAWKRLSDDVAVMVMAVGHRRQQHLVGVANSKIDADGKEGYE